MAESGTVTATSAATTPAQTAPVVASPKDHSSLPDDSKGKNLSPESTGATPPPEFLLAEGQLAGIHLGHHRSATDCGGGTLFFNQARCLIEYRLTEAVVGLIVFLAAGAGAVFSNLAPPNIRRKLQTFYGGLALALLVLILLIVLKPPISARNCELARSPEPEPTGQSTVVTGLSSPIPASPVAIDPLPRLWHPLRQRPRLRLRPEQRLDLYATPTPTTTPSATTTATATPVPTPTPSPTPALAPTATSTQVPRQTRDRVKDALIESYKEMESLSSTSIRSGPAWLSSTAAMMRGTS